MNNTSIHHLDEELILSSPIEKTTTPNNNGNVAAKSLQPPPINRRPTLLHQHSYAGHEMDTPQQNGNENETRHRPFLTTRHMSMEDSNSNNCGSNSTLVASPFPAYNNHRGLFSSPKDNGDDDDSFDFANDLDQALQTFNSPSNSNSNNNNNDVNDDAGRQGAPSPTSPFEQHEQQQHQEETAEERARREEEESIMLAQQLMAEEAMASHRMSADFLRMNSDQFSAEDFEALQNALREEEEEEEEEVGDEEDDEQEEEEPENMSYEALLQLGERIGDVKAERWAMVAHKEIAKLGSYEYDPDKVRNETKTDKTTQCDDIDDSEIKCLVCQFAYEKGDQLRKLPCGHCFHKDCIDQWLQTKDICAYCRQSIVKSESDKSSNDN